ncbi:DNA binding protein [Rhodococcus phage Jflix2]|nr:DNA binding protein [Rhodococcus phage Jflix2]
MKVKVEVTVDIDPESWTMNYGVEGTAAIREDVKQYCRNTIIEQLQLVEVWNNKS